MQLSLNKLFAIAVIVTAVFCFYTHAAGHKNFFTRHVQQERQRAIDRLHMTELNHLIPPFKPLADEAAGRTQFLVSDWEPYAAYYSKIVELMPGRFDGHVFLGYVRYQTGQAAEAALAFDRAADLHPLFFWSIYNQGVMLAQQGRCPEAAARFGRAVSVPLSATMEAMRHSKLYLDLMREVPDLPLRLQNDLGMALEHAQRLGQLAQICAQNPEMRAGLSALAQKAGIQVF